MSSDDNYILIGRIGKTHGLHGYIRIQSFTAPVNNIFNYLPWHIQLNNHIQAIEIASKQAHTDKFIVKFIGYDTPEQAQKLINAPIYMLKTQLPKLPQNEYYWADLIGLTAINQDGVTLGVVTEIFSSGANDVVIVKGEQEHLIPYVPDVYILRIDLPNKTMTVHWETDFT